jgi:MarR family transcriptional regulator, transcriptional regulator for hemolysin
MPKAPETQDVFGFLIHDVARLLRKNFNRRVHSLGMTQEQCRVILHLSRNEGIQQVDLAELLEIKPITLARLLDKLQENDLIERRRNPDDRRAFRLYLTRNARTVLKDILTIGAGTRADAIRDIATSDLEKLFSVLSRLKANLLLSEEEHSPNSVKSPASAQ